MLHFFPLFPPCCYFRWP
ncbi:hypothetical protein VULLAG_LOCUS21820 [Vulpes lagopus]